MDNTEEHPTDKYIGLRIIHVSAILETNKLYFIWENGDEAVIDFSELIATNRHCKSLSNSSEFQTARHIDNGTSLEWSCGVDMGSDHVRWMADLQDSLLYQNKRKSA